MVQKMMTMNGKEHGGHWMMITVLAMAIVVIVIAGIDPALAAPGGGGIR